MLRKLSLLSLFLLRHPVDVYCTLLLRGKHSAKQTRRLRGILAYLDQVPDLKPIRDVFQETYANTLLVQAESETRSASKIIECWPLYREAFAAYMNTLVWQRKRQPSRMPTILYRAAVCACRLGDFDQAQDLLKEAANVTQGKSRNVIALQDTCIKLAGLSKKRNLWEDLAQIEEGRDQYLSDDERKLLDSVDALLDLPAVVTN